MKYTHFILILFVCRIVLSDNISNNPFLRFRVEFQKKIVNYTNQYCDEGIFPEKNKFLSLLGKAESMSQSQLLEMQRIFLRNIKTISMAFSGTKVVVDTLILSTLIDLLKSNEIKISEWSYQILKNKTSFESLKRIKTHQLSDIKSSPIASGKKHELLILCGVRDSAVDFSVVDLAFKANMGDSLSTYRIIDLYLKAKTFTEKKILLEKLVTCGSDTCLKTMILDFNNPIFRVLKSSYSAQPCTANTIRIPIIEGLQRHYPFVPILNDSLNCLFKNREMRNDKEYIEEYFEKVLKWASGEIGILPQNPAPPPVINQGCRIY